MNGDDMETMYQTTSFYPDEIMFNKPIPVLETTEQTINRDESSDLYDLDQEDRTFYHEDGINTNNSPTSKINTYSTSSKFTDTLYYNVHNVKSEPHSADYMDCGSAIVSSSDNSSHYVYTDNIDWSIHSKVRDVCIQDVVETCRRLNLSPDPHQWSHDNVQHWIEWQCREYSAKRPSLDLFHMTGKDLCCMTEDKFKMFAPEAGSILFSRLVVWKSVVEQSTSYMYQHYSPSPINYIPMPQSPPSPDSTSSNPAVLSDTESQPSSPPCMFTPSEENERLPDEPVNHHRQTIQLWQFLKNLLLDGGFNDCIRWIDRQSGVFKIENSAKVARLWGLRKNRPAMNYDKLSRSIRQYYKKNIIKKTEHSKRLVYQFCATHSK
ncbi:hypothetical protein ACF0H5_015876 [Mactra antiquata]